MFQQIWRYVTGQPSKMTANGYMTAPGGRPFSHPGSPYRVPFAWESPPAFQNPDTLDRYVTPTVERQNPDYGGPTAWAVFDAWVPTPAPPGLYANLRAPRSSEMALGPAYNPADLIALDGGQ